MIDSIHQSMIGMALKCGERFRRRYIEGERVPSGIAAARGQGLHAASRTNLRQKILTGVDLPMDAMRDAARDGFVKQVMEGVFLAPDEVPFKNTILNAGLKESIRMTEFYGRHIAPELNPVATEEPFRMDIGLPVPLGGVMDIEGRDYVDDLKTAGKRWPDGKEKIEIQGILYSYVFHKKRGIRPRFTYRVIVSKKGEMEGQTLSLVPTDDDYRAMLLTVSRFWKMIETGTFLPASPGSWWCSVRYCPFHSTCPFVGKGESKKWV